MFNIHYPSAIYRARRSARDGSDMRRWPGPWFFDVRAGSERRRGDRTASGVGLGRRPKTGPGRAEFKRTARCAPGENAGERAF